MLAKITNPLLSQSRRGFQRSENQNCVKCKNRVTVREERKEKSAVVAAAAVSRGCYSQQQQQQQQQQQHNNNDVITTQTRACSSLSLLC